MTLQLIGLNGQLELIGSNVVKIWRWILLLWLRIVDNYMMQCYTFASDEKLSKHNITKELDIFPSEMPQWENVCKSQEDS